MSRRLSPRERRLQSDFQAMSELQAASSILEFHCPSPAQDHYIVTFQGNGLALSSQNNGQPVVQVRQTHQVEFHLRANYPRQMPELKWITPIYHPNISEGGFVCLGGYGTFWVPSLNLDDMCVMLWDMVRFHNFDVASPYNRQAAEWAKTQDQFQFPLDHRPLKDRTSDVHDGIPPVEVKRTPNIQHEFPVGEPVSVSPAETGQLFTALPIAERVQSDDETSVIFLSDVIEAEVIQEMAASTDDSDILFID